jgi:hypothetical protein
MQVDPAGLERLEKEEQLQWESELYAKGDSDSSLKYFQYFI